MTLRWRGLDYRAKQGCPPSCSVLEQHMANAVEHLPDRMAGLPGETRSTACMEPVAAIATAQGKNYVLVIRTRDLDVPIIAGRFRGVNRKFLGYVPVPLESYFANCRTGDEGYTC